MSSMSCLCFECLWTKGPWEGKVWWVQIRSSQTQSVKTSLSESGDHLIRYVAALKKHQSRYKKVMLCVRETNSPGRFIAKAPISRTDRCSDRLLSYCSILPTTTDDAVCRYLEGNYRYRRVSEHGSSPSSWAQQFFVRMCFAHIAELREQAYTSMFMITTAATRNAEVVEIWIWLPRQT